MATRLWAVVFDSADPAPLAEWWAGTLGWRTVPPNEYHAEVRHPTDASLPALGFELVDDPKRTKNRVHLDVASESIAQQAAQVEQLLQRGATPAHIGQRNVPWHVLADPEGNEFCVLEPRERYEGAGLAAIVIDAVDPRRAADFWQFASGWTVGAANDDVVSLYRPGGRPPDLDFVRVVGPKRVKNRVHVDVAPYSSGDRDAEVDRLHAAGARDLDIGQPEHASWRVLADVEGNEFCVLSPR